MNYDFIMGALIGAILGMGIGFAINPIMYYITKREIKKKVY